MKKIFLLVFILQSACTSGGFNRGELKTILGVDKPIYDDATIEKEFRKKANLPKPFKLAVYFKNPKENVSWEYAKEKKQQPWRWEGNDKKILADIATDLKAEGVADVFPLVSSVVDGDDIKSLRLAAAKHHADALMVISGAAQIERGFNDLGWTYLFILPMIMVPANQANSLFIANATIWDVRNEFIYLTAEAESTETFDSTVLDMKNDKEIYANAKTKALAELKTELVGMVKGKKL